MISRKLFQSQWDRYLYELNETGTPCKGPAQARDKTKPDKTPGQRRKTGYKVQFLFKTLSIIDSLLERKIRFIQYRDTG